MSRAVHILTARQRQTAPPESHSMRRGSAITRAGGHRLGFTLTEMLITTAIIVLLLTILVVALSRSSRAAQRANTTFLMTSIGQGLESFRNDHGYLPPVLEADRDLMALPDPGLAVGTYAAQLQDWYSVTSLAEYLLGYGDRSQDGHGMIPGVPADAGDQGLREGATLGFRSPGEDGVWGAILNPRPNFPPNGALASRNPAGYWDNPAIAPNKRPLSGKVYGPYITNIEEASLASINPATGQLTFPGETGYEPTGPLVITDRWGEPIRYYRRLHYAADPKSVDLRSNLGDVFALRPRTLRQGQEADGILDAAGDSTTTRALQSADYALFSSGPDKFLDATRRADPDEFNADNLVQVGP